MKMKVLYVGLLLMFSFVLVFAQTNETLTMTTYYPSPYGSYRELTAHMMKVGRTYSQPATPVNPDDLIVEGSVGVGTNNPAVGLHIVRKGGVRIEGTAPAYQFLETDAAGVPSGGPQYEIRIQGGKLNFEKQNAVFTNADPKITIDNNRVGINETNPLATLHVNGTLKVDSCEGCVVRGACRWTNWASLDGAATVCNADEYVAGHQPDDDDDRYRIYCCQFH